MTHHKLISSDKTTATISKENRDATEKSRSVGTENPL